MLTSSAENMDVSLGQFGGIDDEVFALSPRDHLSDIQKGSLKSVAGGIARCFSGLKLEFRLLMPVELVTRCVMNAAIWYTEGTDVGEYISAIAKTELAQISEDLTALRSKELKTAGDSLTTLLRTAPLLLEMEAGSRRDAALARFADDAEQCQHDADIAFRAVGTMDEQIRAVVIASTAIEATAADGERNFGIVRVELGGQLEKLFELAIVRRDVKNQLNEDPDRRFLDFPGERVRRLNEVVGLLVHVEAWAASHALEPMMPDFVKQPFSIKNLVATGLFRGGRTAAELEKQTTDDGGPAFSPKELQILGGFCSEKIALPPTATPNKSWWGITSESTADPAPEAVAVEAIAVVPTAEVVREPNPAPSRSWWDFSGSAEEQAERTAREKAEEKIAELEAENAAKIAELEAENAAKEAQRAVREAQARREAEAKIAELEAENAAKEVQRALRGARARREAENEAEKRVTTGSRFKLALLDGRGIALEHKDVDATQGHRAFMMRLVSADEAIEVKFTARNSLKVVRGHHTLGYTLDNWYGKAVDGNRQHFSTWEEHHYAKQWEVHTTQLTLTISPKGVPHLVLGWHWLGYSCLVPRGDPRQLTFAI